MITWIHVTFIDVCLMDMQSLKALQGMLYIPRQLIASVSSWYPDKQKHCPTPLTKAQPCSQLPPTRQPELAAIIYKI